MIRLIADVAGTVGMLLFLMAELRQIYKIKKTGKLTGLSYHAYLSKIIAVLATGTCFALSALYFSLFVIILEGIVIMPILYWLYKKRNTCTRTIAFQSEWSANMWEGWNEE